MSPITRHLRRAAAVLLPVVLVACGGDDSSTCSLDDQKASLSSYMDDWYFWYAISPRPNPAPYATVNDYFHALLYTGIDPDFPADKWSFTESTATFNSFFGDGQTLGYGISVAGIEVTGQPDQPLYVRYIESRSPAATAGVRRGDQVISINGRSAADVITADDYSALSPANPGDTVSLVLRSGGVDRTVVVTAAVFDLTPVANSAVVTSPLGRKMGYLVVKDMINQVQPGLETAFAQFKAAGVTEIVLDLRYNGGGLVSVGSLVASYVAGTLGNGHVYASLLYNDKQASQHNVNFQFTPGITSAAGVPRVFVLTGPRTCSASEQVINGLRGIGVDVVSVGDTSCGKPVGFLPTSACGTTFNAVNFESVNERNEGRYFDGFAASCPVAEDFTQAQGSPTDPLLAVASSYADSGSCPTTTTMKAMRSMSREARLRLGHEPGERQGMIGR